MIVEQLPHDLKHEGMWLTQVWLASQNRNGWSWGCVSALDSQGRTIWIADAHRGDGKRYIMRADEKLTAFGELQRPIHEFAVSLCVLGENAHEN